MLLTRTVAVADPDVRANLVDAFAGAGAPLGVTACRCDGDVVTIAFDGAVTAPELIDDLIALERRVGRGAGTFDDVRAAALAAAGLGDPELDERRILERHLS